MCSFPPIARAADLAGGSIRRLSLGHPKAVPAGVYAKTWLEKIGLWEKLKPKVVSAGTVRAALAVVESGNAEAAIVYRTDAVVSKRVRVAFEVPSAEGPAIAYPVALVSDSRHAPAAKRFIDRLAAKEAAAVFTRRGFSMSTTSD